jgi:small subunit ribosomal protein S8
MLTRIRNAILVRKTVVTMPHSKVKETVARVLVEKNFLNTVEVNNKDHLLTITINTPDTNARIQEIDRLSTPGRRMYVKADEIPRVKQGRGIVVISTSQGVMSGDDAKAKRLGGELICKVS